MRPLDTRPNLITRAYDRLVAAIADGTLAPGRHLRQEELAELLGVSRQPISHALQLLKQQHLVEEAGRRGVTVCGVDAARIRDLYQLRTVVDGLAARLAGLRVAQQTASAAAIAATRQALRAGLALDAGDPAASFIAADVAFHKAVYRLSGNGAIAETVAAQWPQFQRSMGVVLTDPAEAPLVWVEHEAILRHILAGDADGAEAAARRHTDRAGAEAARRLSAVAAAPSRSPGASAPPRGNAEISAPVPNSLDRDRP